MYRLHPLGLRAEGAGEGATVSDIEIETVADDVAELLGHGILLLFAGMGEGNYTAVKRVGERLTAAQTGPQVLAQLTEEGIVLLVEAIRCGEIDIDQPQGAAFDEDRDGKEALHRQGRV